MKRKKIPPGSKIKVLLTQRERDLIQENTLYDPNFARLAPLEGKKIRVDMSLDDIEDLQGFIAAEANHTNDKKIQQKLDALFVKLQVFLDTYDDEGEEE